jgi:GxxExxY protein
MQAAINIETEPDLSRIAVDAAYTVHSRLGPGLLENTYEECLCYELKKRGLEIARQKLVPIIYDEIKIDAGYRLDIVIENALIIELKAVEQLAPVHTAQLLTYLKLSNIRTGLLINFNTPLIKDGIKRLSL